MSNAKEIAIGVLGKRYRVAVIDQQDVNHTLKIDPQSIDQDKAMKERTERVLAKNASALAGRKTNDRDKER